MAQLQDCSVWETDKANCITLYSYNCKLIANCVATYMYIPAWLHDLLYNIILHCVLCVLIILQNKTKYVYTYVHIYHYLHMMLQLPATLCEWGLVSILLSTTGLLISCSWYCIHTDILEQRTNKSHYSGTSSTGHRHCAVHRSHLHGASGDRARSHCTSRHCHKLYCNYLYTHT